LFDFHDLITLCKLAQLLDLLYVLFQSLLLLVSHLELIIYLFKPVNHLFETPSGFIVEVSRSILDLIHPFEVSLRYFILLEEGMVAFVKRVVGESLD
jgi:hypothetical protein